VAIERPAGLFGNILARHLRDAGMPLKAKSSKNTYSRNPADVLHTYSSPLWDALDRCNKDSLGLAAESLIKTLSAENTQGRINGEWPHGLNLIERYLNSLGVDDSQFTLDYGSGLSRNNRLSCQVLVTCRRYTPEILCRPLHHDPGRGRQ
jgi:D-alanyl-D-alanine carboxypeptidase